jgi:hypothetical protein
MAMILKFFSFTFYRKGFLKPTILASRALPPFSASGRNGTNCHRD